MRSLPCRADALILGQLGKSRFARYYNIPTSARAGHMYVVGKTGKGKSKFLLSCAYQDIAAGRGCGVIDPHSDLISELLALLNAQGLLNDPTIRSRILYLDPTHKDYIIPFNVLATDGDPYITAQNIIEAFRRTWEDTLFAAPNFENNMLYSLLLLIKTKRTLVELPRVWIDEPFQQMLITEAEDREIGSFFEDRVQKWGREKSLKIESLLNKATALTMNPFLRLMLGQQENRLSFRRMMDEGIIFLANLGQCDEESQRLIGNLITTGIEQAAFSRSELAPEERRPFYLYVDEFQDFSAKKAFSKILSGARKMKLHITLAHQNRSQLSERMMGAVIGNVWTKVLFGISEADAYEFATYVGLGSVDPFSVKDEAHTDMQHPQYMPLTEQYNDLAAMLANQPPRQAVVRSHEGTTQQIWTLSLPDLHDLNDSICTESMGRRGIPYGEAKQIVDQLLNAHKPEAAQITPYEVTG